MYGAKPTSLAQCCDATLVSPLTRTGQPQPCIDSDGAALRVAVPREWATYPELALGGLQRLVVLGFRSGRPLECRRQGLVRDFVRARAHGAPPAVRHVAMCGWARRWWSILSAAVQQAVASTALGCAWPAASPTCATDAPPIGASTRLRERRCWDSMFGAVGAHTATAATCSNHAHCKSGNAMGGPEVAAPCARSSAHACMNAGCPSGVPRTTTPRWASCLSPCHTSSPSSAIPGGAGMASAAMARVLPGFEIIPQWNAKVPATSSNAARAPAGLVMIYHPPAPSITTLRISFCQSRPASCNRFG